jgi:putative flippase GtrA
MFDQQRIVQFARFCAVGGGVAAVDLAIVWVTSFFLPALLAVSVGYVTGVTCHFLLNKFWVFKCTSRRYARQLALYLLQVALCWLMTLCIVSMVLSFAHCTVVLARLVAIPPTTLFTFVFMRFIVFRGSGLSIGPRPVTAPSAEA